MKSILVLEDDKLLNEGVRSFLKRDGYVVYAASSLKEANIILKDKIIDLALIDINLPDGSGIELLDKIKIKKLSTKVVFFTANDTEEDMIRGYEMGCEDYIPKPFSLKVLRHKINVILSRKNELEKNIFSYKELKIDYDKMVVYVNDKIIKLTATEYKLTELLAKNKGHVLTKDIILNKVWDSNGNFVDENTLSVNIQRLRKKIEKDPKNPEYIVTVFAVGYTFGE